jgi:EmrB/QacA subfamily drug resistance transporter
METAATNPRRWLILAAMSMTMFIATVDNTVMTVGLPAIQRGLGASNAQLQWVVDAYTLAFAALLFSMGLLGDRYGRRLVLVAGLAVFTGASIGGAMSSSAGELIAWRAAMGLGAAVVPGCSMAVIAGAFPAAERTRAIGLWSMAAGVGIGAGPVLGGLLLSHFWWGSLLLVNVPFAVVTIAVIAVIVSDARNPAARRLDVPGVLLSVVGVGLLILGVVKGGEAPTWLTVQVLVPIVAGLVLIAILLLVESRMKLPSFDPSLFRNRLFAIGAGILGTSFLIGTGVNFVLTFYLQLVRDYSPIQTGLLMLAMAVGSFIAGIRAAQLAGSLGRAAALGASGLLIAACCAVFAVLGAGTPIWVFEIVYGLFGLGFGAAFAIGMAVTISVIEPARMGAGSAVANTMRHMGTALGVAVLGSVLGSVYRHSLGSAATVIPAASRGSLGSTLQAIAGRSAVVRDAVLDPARNAFISGLHVAMWVSAGLAVIAALAAFAGLPGRPKAQPGPPRPVEARSGSAT